MDKVEKLFTEKEKIGNSVENNEVNEMVIDNTTEKEKDDFDDTLGTKMSQHAPTTIKSIMDADKDCIHKLPLVWTDQHLLTISFKHNNFINIGLGSWRLNPTLLEIEDSQTILMGLSPLYHYYYYIHTSLFVVI